MTALVTGGMGFIGSHLVEELLATGSRVTVLDDLSTGRTENLGNSFGRIEFIQGSVTDAAAVRAAVAGTEVVYHLAALPSVQRSIEDPLSTHETCARGTLEVLSAAQRAGVRRVVYAASSSAYGAAPGAVRAETDDLLPMSPYAAAKLAGEHYCQCFTAAFGLETVRLRFFNIFGPRQRGDSPYSGVIPIFLAAMAAGRAPTIYGDGLQSRDFTYVGNAVQALRAAAVSPKANGGVYNIGSGGSTTLLDLVRHLNQLLATDLEPVHAPPRSGDVRYSQANIANAHRDLGYNPEVSFPEGLRRILKATVSV